MGKPRTLFPQRPRFSRDLALPYQHIHAAVLVRFRPRDEPVRVVFAPALALDREALLRQGGHAKRVRCEDL